MGQIAIATFRTVADKLAAIANTIDGDFGTADGFASPVDPSDSGQALLDTIEALTDPDVLQDLIPTAKGLATELLGVSARARFGRPFVERLVQHCGGLDAYLLANADGNGNVEQVAPEFRNAFGMVSPKYVFPPATTFGTFAASGAAAGTFTDGSAVDTTLYGACDVEVEVINQQLGASEVTVTITGTDIDGNEVTRTATIPSASSVGTKVTADAGVWLVDVTNVEVSGATSGDDLQINGKLRRTIAL